MKLGLSLGTGTARVSVALDFVHRAEALGFDSVWTAEAYGADAVSVATWVLAQTTPASSWNGEWTSAAPCCAAPRET